MISQELKTQYRIEDIEETRRGWNVVSTTGNTYHVSSHTRVDENGSMYFAMSCDCPARKRCRHLDAVEAYQWAQEREDYEPLERTI